MLLSEATQSEHGIYFALRYLYEKGDNVSAGYDICPDNYNPFERAKEHK